MKEDGLTDIEAGDEIRELAKEAGIPYRTIASWLPTEAKHQEFTQSTNLYNRNRNRK